MSVKLNLIRTIEEGEEVPDYSESSDGEEEFQPSKQKKGKKSDFSEDFDFPGNVLEYNKDTWNDLAKYVRRKVKKGLEEKILRVRKTLRKENVDGVAEVSSDSGNETDGQISLSEDEMKKDDIRIKQKKKKKVKTEEKMEFEEPPPYAENVSFYDMNLSRPLLKSIGKLGFLVATPIQAATIPVALLGRDVCGCAATGTGKTAAYMLPTLERLLYRPATAASVTRVLVVVPTRELGVQVYQVTRELAQFTTLHVGLSVGGLDLKVQESVLRKNPDVVIATPGRLIDHLRNTPSFSLDRVEVLVLDEADRMLDEYFQEQMTEIVERCGRTRQTLLFSATMTDAVDALAAVSLTDPVKIFVDGNREVATNLRQEFVKIREDREGYREPILAALICRTFHDHAMVFVQTKKQAHRLHILLRLLGVKAGELHGDLSQGQRLEALRMFKDEEVDVLVATDVAARGLDIKGVKTVVNFLLPATFEQYIHRVGRTGRAGRSGVCVSMVGEAERATLKQILRNAKNPVKARLVPPDIVEKYRKKVLGLEREIRNIIQEEWEEKEITRAEIRANKMEKRLEEEGRKRSGRPKEVERSWFQDEKRRKSEKDRLRLEEPSEEKTKKGRGQRRKKLAGPGGAAEERTKRELEKMALYQARVAKRSSKPSKLRAVAEPSVRTGQLPSKLKKKRKSAFDEDLTDVSRKGVKKVRYEANHFKNQEKHGKKVNKQRNENSKSKKNVIQAGRKRR